LKFGAILVCAKPITQTAYNDEKLLRQWIAKNKKELSVHHGSQLCRHGLFLVTKTYRTPRASINASMEQGKEILLSAKMKAQILGDDGIKLGLDDHLTDKDWNIYAEGPKKDGVVVFFDGFRYPPWNWWWDRSSSVWGGGRGLGKKRRGRERQEGCCWCRSAQWMDSVSSGLVRRGSHGTGKVPQRNE
jgi:hypothetical protein